MSDISGIDPIKQTIKMASPVVPAASEAPPVPGHPDAPAGAEPAVRDLINIQTADASDLGLGEAAGPGGQRGRVLTASSGEVMSAIGSVPASGAMPGLPPAGKPIEAPRPIPAAPVLSMPKTDVPGSVSYSSPSSVKPEPRYLDVQGCTGMGAPSGKSYKVLESDAIAMYSLLKEKPLWQMDELKSALKTYFGIEAEVTKVDGRNAIVGNDGRVIAVDTEGNGAIDINDLQFGNALQAAGVDISQIKSASEMMKDMLEGAKRALTVCEMLEKMNKEIAEREAANDAIRGRASAADAAARGAAGAVAASGPKITPSGDPATPSAGPSSAAASSAAAASSGGASAAPASSGSKGIV